MLKYLDAISSKSLKASNAASRLKSCCSLTANNFYFSSNERYSFFSTINSQPKRGIVLGILRETYDIWERRAPLSPEQVRRLLKKYKDESLGDNCNILSKKRPLSEIIIQPSSNRIFTDDEYSHAGAKLSNDLSSADIILGVKRVLDKNTLIPEKTYMFFAHVIKGQPENMDLMQTIIDKKIQLIDYECISTHSKLLEKSESRKKKKKRLVTFGKFAGIAGMIDILQLVGKRLLASGYSTHFLHCPPAYMFHDVDDAKEKIKKIGSHIESCGLPEELGPLVFAFTGSGNVSKGAMEIFNLLPHKMVTKEELHQLHESKGPHKLVYGFNVDVDDIVRKKNSSEKSDHIDKSHYYSNPMEYEPIFHEEIAPYCNVIVNGIYWDERFPRLLTKQNIHDLYKSDNKRIFAIADISCDVNGSIEFLEKTTSVDKPHFEYLPLSDHITDEISPNGIAMMGVDILPSELPRDSTKHFGDALSPLLEKTIEKCGLEQLSDTATEKIPFPREVVDACISYGGEFTSNFEYIKALLKGSYRGNMKELEPTLCISMKGHLFDSGLINQALNILDDHECHFQFKECNVLPKTGSVPEKSSIVLLISCNNDEESNKIVQKLNSLVELITPAEATMEYTEMTNKRGNVSAPNVCDTPKTILILGAGRVASSLSEYLGRSSKNKIVVASKHASDSYACAKMAKWSEAAEVDIENDTQTLLQLLTSADLVISLLPADLHPTIAKKCLHTKTNLVTASYESDELKNMEKSFEDIGISVLNEVGLDPGMDHMSAMKIIDDIHYRGGQVSSFKSVCGGLPSPEAANNPLLYKFSWSPMGVIKASRNSARFLLDGEIVDIEGKNLLESAQGFNAWPALNLECLPNRNSLVYGKKYGIEAATTIFRGTLRYHGFSTILNDLQKIGLLENTVIEGETWESAIQQLIQTSPYDNLDDMLHGNSGGDPSRVARVKNCLNWLGLTKNMKLPGSSSIVNSFCSVLESKLDYKKDERDVVLMHHEIHGIFGDDVVEVHNSSLQVFGDEKMTAMSKTVGYTTAIAAELILDGTIQKKGLLLPTQKEIFTPCLNALEKEGLKFEESTDIFTMSNESRLG